MKIGIDTLFESPAFPTGATGYMANILRCLAEIDHDNEYFLFVSRRNRHLYPLNQENFHYVTCWASNERRNLRIVTQQMQCPALVRKYGIDVFNSPGNTAPLLLPCASVLTIKTMHHYHFGRDIGWQRALYRRAMVYASAQRADAIIANSQNNRDDIVSFLSLPPERVVIIPEAVDKELFQRPISESDLEEKMKSYGVSRPFILNVSSMWRYKNQLRLVEAFARLLKQQRIPHQLVLIGGSDQPEYSAELDAAIRQTGLQNSIRLLGYLPHAEIIYFYRAAEVFVYPSLFETFGLTLLEAMASGTPIVASDRGSLPEILGEAGIMVDAEKVEDLAGAIAQVLGNRELRDQLVEKGYRRVQEFSWEKTAVLTRDVFLRAGNHK